MTTTTTKRNRPSPLRVVAAAAGIYAAVMLLFVAMLWSMRGGDGGASAFGPQVAIVELEGVIIDVYDLVRDLKRARDNPLVRAVVIRINSPGGVVGPTQEVHQGIQRLRQAGKPVVASLGSIAASGGYYVAVAADEIVSNPGTLTGSIGVIMQMANVEGLMKKVGVEYIVVKAGQYKDLGNFARPMLPEERRVLQALLDDVHGQFISAVAKGRKLDEATVRKFADGRIFSGAQAKDLKMVDALGSLEDAVNRAATLGKLPLPANVAAPRRKFSFYDFMRNEIGIPAPSAFAGRLPIFRTPLYLMD